MQQPTKVLRVGTFQKPGCGDAHVRIWRRGPEALYVDVEEGGHARTDTWPRIGRGATSEAELQARYEEEFQSKGYDRGHWRHTENTPVPDADTER